ncbi:MAG: hypothetical protein D6685_13460 [Bacteroidetes bacterium]|nr:MAG: hypothetical protein D6685_13460 [Bacteroidota bacterium]
MVRTLLFASLALLLAGCTPAPVEDSPAEVRGIWLTNVDSDVMMSRASIAEAMQFLAEHHFNVVYPVVWNKGYTLYPSAVMDSLFGLPIDPVHEGRDPLQEIIEEAHRHGLRVMPWFEFGFAASYQAGGGHLLAARPHWAARDAAGRLLTKNGFEWMNAYHPEVQDFLLALVKEVVQQYDIDGVQGDDRLPAQPVEGGYSAYTDSLYRAEHGGQPPPADPHDPAWKRWRADRLNAFAERLYREVKALDPDVLVTWSPSIYPWAYDEYLQDWPAWLRGGYADLVHPQVYRYEFDAYRRALLSQGADSLGLTPAQHAKVIPGVLMKVGDYRMTPTLLRQVVQFNRTLGYPGEVFFFYEGLRLNDDEVADSLRASAYRTPARLPDFLLEPR